MKPMHESRRFWPPVTRTSFRFGVSGSAVVHLLALGAVLWGASQGGPPGFLAVGTLGAPTGGGGGVRLIELPPASGTGVAAADAIEQPLDEPVQRALPEPQLRAAADDPSPSLALGDLGSLVKIEGPPGGGVGGGLGTGVGEAAGPGAGGEGGTVFPPQPRQLVLTPPDPPGSVRGREFTVTFWIDPRGSVSRIEVEPPIPDSDYRRKFMGRMREITFQPARTLDGTPIAAQFVIVVVPGF